MKRFGPLLLILMILAVIIVLALRQKGPTASSGVATLLPAEASLFIHIPDFETDREAWHRTDLYQLYREPAVQDFLRKPKAQLARKTTITDAWRDAASLRMRDTFLAVNSFESPVRLVGGFEFRCGEKEGQSVIEAWRARWRATGGQGSSAAHGRYTIDIITAPRLTIASVIVGNRFFAATNIDDLRELLDRLDGHAKNKALSGEENFRGAMKQMPADYSLLLYLQPKSLAQKLVTLRAQSGRALPAGQETLIERMTSFAHAMVFEGGKLRDIDWVAMPRLVDAKITRDTLSAASKDTLLYLATILNVRQQLSGRSSGGTPFSGVTVDDWERAFGDELSLLAEWPANARMPGVVATLAVRDFARAKTVAAALAETSAWQPSIRNGTEFFTAPALGLLPAVRPVAALSEKRLALGLDIASVERAISLPANANGLATTSGFRDTSRLVPEPQQLFAWLDLGALYSRLDATLRPLLQLSAAFMPEPSNRFDVSKLPPAEVVTKHLSPVIASQIYTDGGYRSESVGPITLGQASVLGIAGYAASIFFSKHGDVPAAWRIRPAPTASPSQTP